MVGITKKTIILISVILLVSPGLSGCTSNDSKQLNNGIPSQIQLLNYSVKTFWTIGDMINGITNFSENGFYHYIPLDANSYSINYVIYGTVKNIGDKKISISFNAIYLNSNGIEIVNGANQSSTGNFDSSILSNLFPGQTASFSMELYKNSSNMGACPNWNNISSFKWAITTS